MTDKDSVVSLHVSSLAKLNMQDKSAAIVTNEEKVKMACAAYGMIITTKLHTKIFYARYK